MKQAQAQKIADDIFVSLIKAGAPACEAVQRAKEAKAAYEAAFAEENPELPEHGQARSIYEACKRLRLHRMRRLAYDKGDGGKMRAVLEAIEDLEREGIDVTEDNIRQEIAFDLGATQMQLYLNMWRNGTTAQEIRQKIFDRHNRV